MHEPIKAGDKVRTGVYVCGEWKPMWLGVVTCVSNDGTLATVDIGTMHGCAPNVRTEQVSHLRRESDALPVDTVRAAGGYVLITGA